LPGSGRSMEDLILVSDNFLHLNHVQFPIVKASSGLLVGYALTENMIVFANAGIVEKVDIYNTSTEMVGECHPSWTRLCWTSICLRCRDVISGLHFFRKDSKPCGALVITASSGGLYPVPYLPMHDTAKHGLWVSRGRSPILWLKKAFEQTVSVQGPYGQDHWRSTNGTGSHRLRLYRLRMSSRWCRCWSTRPLAVIDFIGSPVRLHRRPPTHDPAP
jgi:hypothetical protein